MSKLGTAEFTSGGVILDHDSTDTDTIHKQLPFLFLFCPLQLSSMASTLTFSDEYSFFIEKKMGSLLNVRAVKFFYRPHLSFPTIF